MRDRLFALENLDSMNPQARLHVNAAIEAKQKGGAIGDVLYKGLMTKAHELGAHPAILEKVHRKLHPYEQHGQGLMSGIGKFFGLTKMGGVEHYGSGNMYGGSTFDNPYQQGSGMIPIPGGDEILGALTDPEGTVQTLATIGEGMFGRSSEPNFGNAQDACQQEKMGRKDTIEELIKWRQGTAFKRDAQLELAFMQEYGDQNLPADTPMPSNFPQKAASWGVDRDIGGMNDFWREQLGRQIRFQSNWPNAYAQLRELKSPEETSPKQEVQFYQQYPTLDSLGDNEPANVATLPDTNRELVRGIRPITYSVFRRPMGRR